MREKLIELLYNFHMETNNHICDGCGSVYAEKVCEEIADHLIANGVTVLPCKIGDTAWAIRNHTGHLHPHSGIVSDMYFVKDMKLCVVVHGIARGEWGKTVFGTYEEAERAIEERKKK